MILFYMILYYIILYYIIYIILYYIIFYYIILYYIIYIIIHINNITYNVTIYIYNTIIFYNIIYIYVHHTIAWHRYKEALVDLFPSKNSIFRQVAKERLHWCCFERPSINGSGSRSNYFPRYIVVEKTTAMFPQNVDVDAEAIDTTAAAEKKTVSL